ncbi:helix-turn-helix transcriptional regulator [candidate division KSB1 bacterium]|nr:helix-turn-helix transcriptional regulator [candidate division KSB1 bacterium]
MSEQIVNIIILIAGVQGLFLAIFIFHRFRELYANRFLAGLMLVAALVLFNLYLGEQWPGYRLNVLNLLTIGLALLIGPLQFLYARYLILYRHQFRRRDWLHFLPFVIYELSVLPLLFHSPEPVAVSLQTYMLHGLPIWYILFNWALVLVCLSYCLLILYHLHAFRQGLKKVVSSLDAIRLRWLHNITYLSVAAWMIFLIQNLVFILNLEFDPGFAISSSLSGLFIYLLGYWGLFKSDYLLQPGVARSMEQLALVKERHHPGSDADKGAPRYEKSGLSPQKADQILSDLKTLMQEQKPYLDSELTLNRLAEQLDVSPHNLSEVLNIHGQSTFFDFVNQYRMDHVKRELINPERKHEKILAIALDAGFNSKTSFNMIFKKHTGMTPSEYRQSAGIHYPL